MSIATSQVPGVYRRRVGEVLVTALNDGHIILPQEYFQNVTPDEIDRIMRAAGRRPPFTTSINAFLLQWPGRTVLVDTGAGSAMGPIAGKLMADLAVAGVAVDEIDAILMTHLHVDHVGGLLDGAGAPAFAKAELIVAEAEMAFWHDDASMQSAPDAFKSAFEAARRMTAPYAARTRRFAGGEVVPGVEAVALPGHTPGHTGYLVSSGGEKLLIWGDVVHLPILQSARPEVTLVFDTDQPQAAKSRRKAFARAANEDLLVTGMHLSFPGFARIASAGDGFVVQPEVWAELPA